MTKICPNCGKQVPDDANFCMDCGSDFEVKTDNNSSSIFTNGKIFLIIIIFVVIVGAIVIATSGDNTTSNIDVDDVEHVDLSITEVNGWDYDGDKKSYTLYTEALFNSVPNDLNGYSIKTTYIDSNDTQIGYETEKLNNVYYDSDYPMSFGHYTTYKIPDPDSVKVEIIKNGKVIDTFTEKIDTNKIDYLN